MKTIKQLLPRVIPVLLLKGRGALVKTIRFSDPVYVGDPLNAVKIFNEKQVDEIIVLDILASKEKRLPDFEYIEHIATECFMPVTYGGGVNSIESFQRLIAGGVEKVALNTASLENISIIKSFAGRFGSSSVVVTVDVKKDLFGRKKVFAHERGKITGHDPVSFAQQMEENGAGEILLQSVDRDGTMSGYDLDLIRAVSHAVKIPVIACGGAGTFEHFSEALQSGASAVAAGSKFVFFGKHRAVLISYLSPEELHQLTA